MVPILYDTITEGTVPSDFGLGCLTDALECYVEESRNSEYELTLVYAAQGIHAEDIQVDRYIKAKPNFTDNDQIFRIYKVGKNINGRFEVNAQHISYDLSGKVIMNGTANNIVSACALLEASAGSYTITTTKSTVGDFTITAPSSVRSWFGGKEGSLLDVYGGGEWHFNNFVCTLAQHRGTDRGVTIRYGKNLTELNQTIDASGLYTHVLSYYQKEGVTVSGNEIATGLSGDKKVLVLDASNDFETEPDQTDLDNYSTAYIAGHSGLTTPSVNFTLNFVQTGELSERVDLCDTVHVYFEPLGINATVKCIRVKWDVLEGRYIETEFGDPKTNITDTISGNDAAVAAANANAAAAMNAVGSKKRVFINAPVPPYDEGDLWVDNGTIYVCVTPRAAGYVTQLGETTTAIYDGDTTDTTIVINGESHTATLGDVATYDGDAFVWNGSAWVEYAAYIRNDFNLATDYVDNSELEDTIAEATSLITGGLGGNVIIHLDELDHHPYEILILVDSDDISTATKVWRWNAAGLGYSSTGYSGTYDTAISIDPDTQKGTINAEWIATGTLNAQNANVQDLTAAMFSGKKIVLGGADDATLEVHDSSNPPNTLIKITGDGLECFGEPVGGITPSVVFNKHGVTGYSDSSDKDNSAIFWTHEQDFHMKNAVIENETSLGGKIRFVPMNTGTNNGIAIVAAV